MQYFYGVRAQETKLVYGTTLCHIYIYLPCISGIVQNN